MRYSVVYEQGDTSWGAYVPDLPGCVAVGATGPRSRPSSSKLSAPTWTTYATPGSPCRRLAAPPDWSTSPDELTEHRLPAVISG
jgi:hypothetical protein